MKSDRLGLASGRLCLSSYEPDWPLLFLEERERLCAALGAQVLDVQHIGSTSIPGMPAKPILDIGVAAASFEKAACCIPLMEKLGYSYKGENGIPPRGFSRNHQANTGVYAVSIVGAARSRRRWAVSRNHAGHERK